MSSYSNCSWKGEIPRFDDKTITFLLHSLNVDLADQPSIEEGANKFIKKFKEGGVKIKVIYLIGDSVKSLILFS